MEPQHTHAMQSAPVDIAIIGMACRFPGAPDLASFWRLLSTGGNAVATLPAGRARLAGVTEPPEDGPSRHGGFLDSVDTFDPAFFGISPREAVTMDPQQRLVLELSWQVLEDAAVRPADLRDTSTGVFIGSFADDFGALVHRVAPGSVTRHTLAGTRRGLIANRVSYALGLQGPSMVVDAAQASSLVAVQLACDSLRAGAAELAVAGGVNLLLDPATATAVESFGGLSPDGRCYTFDARANGFVRGEGGGVVLLKRLADALADGDRVHAVIRGGAVNNDGATEGLTVPSPDAQAAVLRRAYASATVSADEVQYVELHGTGTRVGDPVEASALGAAFGAGVRERPLHVGSVKTNIGHLEGAAGIAGLIKTVLSIRNRQLPPSLNHTTPNPAIDLEALGLRVQRSLTAWPAPDGPLVAGVSSFGMGGTNCHLVLSEAPAPAARPEAPASASSSALPSALPFPLSGRTETALRAQAERLHTALESDDLDLADVAFSLATTREDFARRAVVLAADREALRAGLDALARGERTTAGPSVSAEVRALVDRYEAGEVVDWAPVFAGGRPARVALPGYVFDRARYWPGVPPGAGPVAAEGAGAAEGVEAGSRAVTGPSAGHGGDTPAGGAVRELLEVVRRAAADVLGHGDPADVATDLTFRDLGLDSIGAVELRDAVQAETGIALPSTVLFDHPTPHALARHLSEAHAGATPPVRAAGAASTAASRDLEDDPVVVVSMACRYPGGVTSPEELWQLVADGTDAVGDFPTDRGWDLERLYHPDPEHTGTSTTRHGGFLHTAAHFDPAHFGISPREALSMDPQQRLMLELTVEAFERAGIDPAGLRGSDTGVFVGATGLDYGPRLADASGDTAGHLLTGVTPSVISGRVAYTFGLSGPAVTVDTACSSSLVALHQAVQALRSGECGLVLAGGVTVMSSPGMFVEFSRQRGLAADGRCKAFSARADGTGWAEGAGLLLLERLSDARRNHHPVLAVVRGSAVNQDGASNGLTAPNGPAQQRVIRQALATAGLRPADVDAVEAHGTGTTLGDPIEAQALHQAYGSERPAERPLWLGSLKSNIGHTQAAAGVGGIIKMVQAFHHRLLPGTLHAEDPTPHVDWENTPLALLTEAQPWPGTDAPRRAAVSSFGISGTNAHVIIEEPPAQGAKLAVLFTGQGSQYPGMGRDLAEAHPRFEELLRDIAGRFDSHLDRPLLDVMWAGPETDEAALLGRTRYTQPALFAFETALFTYLIERGLAPDYLMGHSIGEVTAAHVAGTLSLDDAVTLVAARSHLMEGLPADTGMLGVTADQGQLADILHRHAEIDVAGYNSPRHTTLAGTRHALAALAQDLDAAGIAHRTLTVSGAFHSRHLDPLLPELTTAAEQLAHHAPAIPVVTNTTGQIATTDELTDPTHWAAQARTAVHYHQGITTLAELGVTTYIEIGPDATLTHLARTTLADDTVTCVATQNPRAEQTAVFAKACAAMGGWQSPTSWVLSARTEEELAHVAGRLADHATAHPGMTAGAIAEALARRRQYVHRAVLHAADRGELLAQTRALATGQARPGLTTGRPADGGIAVLFTGQGAQYPGMGRDLAEAYPRFGELLRDIAGRFDSHLDHPLLDVMWADPDSGPAALLHHTRYTQPALFSFETALFTYLTERGLAPDYLMGHSIGEVTAAHVAGTLSLDDAVTLVTTRAHLMQQLPTDTGMLSAGASAVDLQSVLARHPEVDVAGHNSPRHTSLAGSRDALAALAQDLDAAGISHRTLAVSGAFHSRHLDPLLPQLTQAARHLTHHAPTIPIVTNTTGQIATTEQLTDPDHWAAQARTAVHYHQGNTTLTELGVTTYLEIGPDATLTHLAQATLGDDTGAAFLATQNPRGEQRDVFAQALAALHTTTPAGLTWPTAGGPPAPLPTYPFTRAPYWLAPQPHTDATQIGLGPADHPLLAAASEQPDGTHLFTTTLTTAAHPWLADHTIAGTTLLPGTALLELALHAGELLAHPHVAELTLQSPVVLPAQLQLTVETPTDDQRHFTIHTRTADGSDDAHPWTLRATGTLTSTPPAPRPDHSSWAADEVGEPADLTGFYDVLADHGYHYGPAFRGLDAHWPTTGWARVTLPTAHGEPAGYGIHPALLDAALHTLVAPTGPDAPLRLPFSFTGVTAHPTSEPVGALLVHATPHPTSGDSFTLRAYTENGTPALTITGLTLATADPRALKAPVAVSSVAWLPVETGTPVVQAGADGGRTAEVPSDWVQIGGAEHLPGIGAHHADLDALLAALADGAPAPATVLYQAPTGNGDVIGATHEVTAAVLSTLQTWLTTPALADTRLVVLTTAATSPHHQHTHLPHAALTGLLRTAHTEHPHAIAHGDLPLTPLTPTDIHNLGHAVTARIPQFTLHDDTVLTPQLTLTTPQSGDAAADFTDGTVLVTGGTGGLGAMLARHLVTRHGVRHLLLASRRGPAADGADRLTTDLQALGATVRIAAADLADRDTTAHLLDTITPEHPLTAVFHLAGTLDDALLTDLTPDRTHPVLHAKADAAWHLHDLTRHHPLTHFVLYSSVTGLLGWAGQANYAAANTFLDALAEYRHSQGLPATSLAWGLWAGGMGATLDSGETARWAAAGMTPLSDTDGTALLDAALGLDAPLLAPVRWDRATLTALAQQDELPAVLRRLVPARRQRADAGGRLGDGGTASGWQRDMARLSELDRATAVRELVTRVCAAVLHVESGRLATEQAFKQLGFDSLTAVELRNRLNRETGLRLPSTLIFDHPTPDALAAHITRHITEDATDATAAPVPVRGRDRARIHDGEFEDDPIVVVSMACRYPGGVTSPEELWQLVADGTDAISGFPTDRGWDLERLYHPDPEHTGTSTTRHGGFLHTAAHFDPAHFGISPREALTIDPQQRLLLELTVETLERAGIDPDTLNGTNTGVFTGIMYDDYGARLRPAPTGFEGYITNGSMPSIASGRIAYTFGLQGPALTIDTACSSSLVALHQATQSLRTGECDLVLTGGATVMATPSTFIEFSRQRALANDGRCKAFSAHADGTGWAEGAGLLLLERLSDARANNHPILAVIAGTAVNQDGASNGLTAPNGPAQQRVIHQALTNARLTPDHIDIIEAHGTGTTLGDPIEVQALMGAYGLRRDPGHPLYLGSLKSNIGHTQAAAGVGGIIKIVQALHHGVMPRTLHADDPTPHIDWTTGAISLLTEAQPWPETGTPRRAAVSSFGISGTNAHVIIEEPPAQSGKPSVGADEPGPGRTTWVLSARTEDELARAAGRLADHATAHPDVVAGAIADTLARRHHHAHRAVLQATDREELMAGTRALAAGRAHAGLTTGHATGGKLAVLFTGQGAQYPGMGRALAAAHPRFGELLRDIAGRFDSHLDHPLLDVMWADPDSGPAALLHHTRYTQPALFAFETALFTYLTERGLAPDYLMGHSIGEITAAHVAGTLSLDDAVALVTTRAHLMQQLPTDTGMLSAGATAVDLHTVLARHPEVDVAGHNSPRHTTLAGTRHALAALAQDLDAAGITHRTLTVSGAFHSRHLDTLLPELTTAAEQLDHHAPAIPVVTNTTGRIATTDELTDPAHWATQARTAVHYHQGITTLTELGVTTYLEIGPDTTLTHLTRTTLADDTDDTVTCIATQNPRAEQQDALDDALAALHTVTPGGLTWPTAGGPPVPLPTYPFTRAPYWLAPQPHTDATQIGLGPADHPLLAAASEQPDGTHLFTTTLSTAAHPWLADHTIAGTTLLPGTALLELALHAGELLAHPHLAELTLQSPVVLPAQLQLTVETPTDDQRHFTIHTRTPDATDSGRAWTLRATGTLTTTPPAPADPASTEEPGEPADLTGFYDALADHGYAYGPAFRGLDAHWPTTGWARVTLPNAHGEPAGYGIHPALLDAALHTLVAPTGPDTTLRLPFTFTGVTAHPASTPEPLTALRVRTTPHPTSADTFTVAAYTETGTPVLTITGLTLATADPRALRAAVPVPGVAWVPVEPSEVSPAPDEPLGEVPSDWVQIGGADPLPGITAHHPDLDALLAALADGAPAPTTVLYQAPTGNGDVIVATHEVTAAVLSTLQTWLTTPALADTRLTVLTTAATGPHRQNTYLPHTALTGLLRTAHTENPEVITHADLPSTPLTPTDIHHLHQAVTARTPQFTLHDDRVLTPRLTPGTPRSSAPAADFAQGTVLVTGGTGALGAVTARYLATRPDVGRLVLVSRRGADAPGSRELIEELTTAGTPTSVVACDVSDYRAVRALMAEITAAGPLTGVVHSAGTVSDATLTGLRPEQLASVLTAKVDAAFNLHRATLDQPLAAFVVYSSVTGLLGSSGQANYAAANTFLDALAEYRHAQGLPATSLAWGLWAGGMGATLDSGETARWAAAGMTALTDAEGTALLDAALALDAPLLAPVRWDRATLTALAQQGELPALLARMAPAPRHRSEPTSAATWQEGMSRLSERERETAVRELVTRVCAAVLHTEPGRLSGDQAFKQLGFDSLTAVELRNRLNRETGLRLATTLVFDHPTPDALAAHITGLVTPTDVAAPTATARIAAVGDGDADPIVVVSMACRYPGGVTSPEELWQLVADGTDAISGFPTDRGWDLEHLYHPDPDHTGTSTTRHGGFLHTAAHFDPAHFGISPREALTIDPQQRLLLELTVETLERAGIDPDTLNGTNTGVFTGIMYDDYGARLRPAPTGFEGYITNGSMPSIASGRIAYTFGLQGPALTIDTACSSSLVALHQATQSLRTGECDLVLTGGATVMATPSTFIEFSRQRALANDGRCKAFSAHADGTGWAEGAGLLLLERLSDARANNHPILAVIAGTAVNQDGASNGLTAPNGPAQQRVIHQALTNARLTPDHIDIIEAHGTGTTLGDPIEAQALHQAYGSHRPSDRPLWLGSLKSNIGHTQAAAGVGGIIKMIQALHHRQLPATLHADDPTPHIDWDSTPLTLITHTRPWPETGAPRRAAVSSFGISGTNAHVIIEEPPALTHPTGDHPEPEPASDGVTWFLSARTEEELARAAGRLADHATAHPALTASAIGDALARRRHHPHRAVLHATERDELLAQAGALAARRTHPGLTTGHTTGGKLAVLFTGQGAQYPGMGRALAAAHPRFGELLADIAGRFDTHLDHPLTDVMWAEPDTDLAALLDHTQYTQPALFAFETALFAYLSERGLAPDYLMGHSIGEITAAHVAGTLSLDDAVTLVTTRAHLMQQLPTDTGMLSATAGIDQLRDILDRHAEIDVAGHNSPRHTTLAGTRHALAALAQDLDAAGITHRTLTVSGAFHSRHLDPLLPQLTQAARRLTHHAPTIPIVTNTTGQIATTEQLTDPTHWATQARTAVHYHQGITTLTELGVTTYLEIGPDTTLTHLTRTTLADDTDDTVTCIATQNPRAGQAEAFSGALATLRTTTSRGLARVTAPATGAPPVLLPTYPFTRTPLWLAPQPQASARHLGLSGTEHPLLATATELPDGTHLFTTTLSTSAHPWLADHTIAGTVLLPGTALLELALHAGLRTGCEEVEELLFQVPVALSGDREKVLHLLAGPADDSGRRPITIYSRDADDEGWTRNATGTLAGV